MNTLTQNGASGVPPTGLLDRREYELIRSVLFEENGAIRRAAAKLGISHQSLLRRLKKWPELRPAKRLQPVGDGI